jgi:hypothetical protein
MTTTHPFGRIFVPVYEVVDKIIGRVVFIINVFSLRKDVFNASN